ncbi:N-acetylmuramoyl-L-alanine amidase [Spirochaetia bacterium]|nr:N-acetylmuramoyl-L-alanine amidase [Spirochaetia bacterium]
MSNRTGRRLPSIRKLMDFSLMDFSSNCLLLFPLLLILGIGQSLSAQTLGVAAAQPSTATPSPPLNGVPVSPAFPPNAALPSRGEPTLSLDETLRQLSVSTGSTAVQSSGNGDTTNRAELRWDPFFGTGVLSVAGHQAAFDTGGEPGLTILDSRQIFSLPSPYLEDGALRFPETFVAALKRAFDNSIEDDQTRLRIAAIIVDPGHGGKDTGALRTHTVNGRTLNVVEKEVNLNAAKMLYARLQAAYPDKRILLTRNSDTFPSLEDRGVLANSVPLKDNEAIVYISIHANSSFDKKSRGYEVYYLSPNLRRNVIDRDRYSDNIEIVPILNDMMEEEYTTESTMIAQSIEKRIGEAMGGSLPSRGVKAENFAVVRNARMPAVLVELAFVSNEKDALILTDDALLRKLTDAIYKGITDYVGTFEGTGGFTVNP